ncbi:MULTISPECIES: metal-dependent transcriptional regulator [Rhodococcus]|uniref:metal-dependent transcriptional regulator n=1 Tax=Rhodococcus TaxID=1827 RepID=UPI001D22EBEF|nr:MULTISPECIES: metal-dependent transcriptional regulator [Rhodococcus]MBY6385111.1 metal-dependent transcriptional regulator [Rhodococcus erythropolis]MDJ0436885.1 metal-dependent transcriptional regulator [Rhodococcus qingshengii]
MAAHKTGTSEASSTSDGDSTSTHGAAIDTLALSSVAQDYLKVIWTIQEWSHERVSTKLLSEKMNVSASTVSEAIRKLSDQGLVDHARYGSIALTDSGRAAAVSMVRRHRLIETYLVQELGYGWDEVHDEAEVLEHAVSDLMISRMDAKLGFPERDPHGDPIPATDGSVPTPPARQLSDFANGERGRVARISDSDPEMLRYFDSVGVSLDVDITVEERRDFAGTVSVRLGDSPDTIDLGSPVAQAIWLV